MASILVVTATVLVRYNIPALKEWLYELIPAFLFSLVAMVVVSLVT